VWGSLHPFINRQSNKHIAFTSSMCKYIHEKV
jgi:hypothetical protein